MKKLLACALILLFIMPACLAQTGVFRALSAGIVHYDDGRVRGGGLNSTQGVYDALSRAFGNSGGFISTMGLDLTKDELMYTISETFREAQGSDVSLVYINAHGGGILVHDGTFYWFGEHKGERSSSAFVGVTCYSSKDLVNWKYEGVALSVSDDPESDITRGYGEKQQLVKKMDILLREYYGEGFVPYQDEVGLAEKQGWKMIPDEKKGVRLVLVWEVDN